MPGSLGKSQGLGLAFAVPRRYKVVLTLTGAILIVTYFLSAIAAPASVPVPSSVREHLPDHIPRPNLPDSITNLIPFKPPTHRPPEQVNSKSGETRWYADWRWRN